MRYQLVAFLLCGLSANFAHAQWGNLKGRILLDGDVPQVRLLVKKGDKTVKDAEVCAAQDIPDESLVVDKDSKGIANVAVWLAKKPAEIHPVLLNPAVKGVTVNITGARFTPHVTVVRTDQMLNSTNLDPIFHNQRIVPLKNTAHSIGIAPNGVLPPLAFKLHERTPIPMACDIHPWMRGYLLVVDHPYATITDKDGNFEIKDLPVGEHEFKIWHERGGWLVNNPDNPKKGLIVTIDDGKPTALDDIQIPVKVFTEVQK